MTGVNYFTLARWKRFYSAERIFGDVHHDYWLRGKEMRGRRPPCRAHRVHSRSAMGRTGTLAALAAENRRLHEKVLELRRQTQTLREALKQREAQPSRHEGAR